MKYTRKIQSITKLDRETGVRLPGKLYGESRNGRKPVTGNRPTRSDDGRAEIKTKEVNKMNCTDFNTPIHFSGDLVIIDPCYLKKNRSDWERCKFGEDMGALGFENSLVTRTIYGDWDTEIVDTDSGKTLGYLGADSGQVGFFTLDEIRKYNPEYDPEKDWFGVLIPGFSGTVEVKPLDGWARIIGTGSVNFKNK